MPDTAQVDLFDPTAEIDLSEAGLQRQRAVFEITDVAVNEAKSGRGSVLYVQFVSTTPIDGLENFRATDYITVKHDNAATMNRGLSALKRLFNAVFGITTGRVADLQGQYVSAEVWEDDEGFRRIGRYQAVEEEAEGDEFSL